MVILIPAYEPDERLIKLVKEIRIMTSYRIVVVDDGSGKKYTHIFNSVKIESGIVLTCNANKGKSEALKSGFRFINSINEDEGIVTVDCDGQHLVEDIIKVAEAVKKNKDKIIYDTQTGLRGFSISMIGWIANIPGSKYEYEMNQLLEAKAIGYEFYELAINTVYLEENKSSHFNVLKDSLAIYFPIIKFSMSSIISALIDFILLMIIEMITSNLFLSVLISRFFSASLNYTLNKEYVFSKSKGKRLKGSLTKYILLVVFIMLLNYEFLRIYTFIGLPLVISKILTECTLFFFSYFIQKRYIFAKNY